MTEEKEYCSQCEDIEYHHQYCTGPEERQVCPYAEEIQGKTTYCDCCKYQRDECRLSI